MKKISIATAHEIEKVAAQGLTVGLDLGDRSSWYCVLNEAGEVLLEPKLATTPKAMKEAFGGMSRSRIALETGMHSPWVSRLLSELGHEVIVAHARNVRLIGRAVEKMIASMPEPWPGWRGSTRSCWGRCNTAVKKRKRI
jgi:transposase